MATNHQQEQPAASAAVFEPFIKKPEVAKRLGKRMRTVDSWMQQGLLPYYKIGRSVAAVHFPSQPISRWIDPTVITPVVLSTLQRERVVVTNASSAR